MFSSVILTFISINPRLQKFMSTAGCRTFATTSSFVNSEIRYCVLQLQDTKIKTTKKKIIFMTLNVMSLHKAMTISFVLEFVSKLVSAEVSSFI